MSRHVETVLIGLHDVNARALGYRAGLYIVFSFSVTAWFDGDCVDTSDTSTAVIAEVDRVLDRTTADIGLVSVLVAIIRLILDEEGVVVFNGYSAAVLIQWSI